MGCCRCCTTTGACCNGGVCTEETCADCEDEGGLFQGVGTTCEGEDECPCDPPANPSLCEKCDGVSSVGYCPEERPNCCDGTCQSEECGVSCEGAADCPTYGLPCEDLFPGAPEQCCDGVCEPAACWPGAQVTISLTKKVGCTAGFLSGIAEGDTFDVVLSGGALAECGVTSVAVTSAPCLTAWTLGEECEVTDLTFDASVTATCEQCYELVSWTSCRMDCNGDCA
jgi:hypothetical protein